MYVELHCHSFYSLLEGASSPEDLVLRARELGYNALALTDHDGLYGSMAFAQTANAFGLRPITGAEVTLEGGHHLTLLVRSRRGYANLCRLLSTAHLAGPRAEPRVSLTALANHSAGLVALSGCRHGAIAQHIDRREYTAAEEAARRYLAVFGKDNYYLELQQNLVYGDTARIRRLVALAEHLDIGYVATNNVHYHDRALHWLQDVLVAIRTSKTLDECHSERRANAEFHLKSPGEMAELFHQYPEALSSTRRIAERCEFNLTRDLDYQFPAYPVPDGQTPDSYLRELCYRQAQDRYFPLTRTVEHRIEAELALIRQHQLAGYFLIVSDIVRFAHEHGYPARGRGSAVSSIVCYLLGLSHIDPIYHRLNIGRFLNEELQHYPDIDIDLSREGREELIQYVYRTYGAEHTALVSTHICYRARSAVRDVGKALGIPETDLAALSDHLSHALADDLPEILGRLPQFKHRASGPVWQHLVRLSKQIQGLPRHISQHVGGMVIASQPLVELVPLQPSAMPDRVVCQWDKDSCADAGFIKIDLLALGMLSAVEETLDRVAQRHGKRPDLARIDMNDPAVYDMIASADTVGVFQIESRAQMQVLPRTQPRSIEDLTVQVALIRPGPGVSKGIAAYLDAVRAGTWTYDHPSVEPVLRDTKGVILYQDQVIEVAQALAGFTAGQGEVLRRAMSRKRSHQAMETMREQFFRGAAARGVDEATTSRVWTKVTAFANYGFPRAHAAAFGLLAYQTAWLRRHYPPESYCALLSEQPMGFYSPEVILGDARRHGFETLGPDINRSRAVWSLEADALRTGLNYVKDLSKEAAQRVEGEREAGGPYRSLWDFWRRTRLRREPIENLIAAGAFDWTGLNRRELIWQLGLFYRPLGAQLPLPLPIDQDMMALASPTAWQRMVAGYGIMGFSPEYHPLSFARSRLSEAVVASFQVAALRDGGEVTIAGLVVCRQRPHTAKGIVFLTLEDEHGLVNAIVYPGVVQRYKTVIQAEPFLIIQGRVQQRDGTTNIIAERVAPLRFSKAFTAPHGHDWG